MNRLWRSDERRREKNGWILLVVGPALAAADRLEDVEIVPVFEDLPAVYPKAVDERHHVNSLGEFKDPGDPLDRGPFFNL